MAAARLLASVVGIFLLAASDLSAAAREPTLEPGARVRVRISAPRQSLTGTVMAWERDSILINVTKPARLAGTRVDLSREPVTRLEVSQGKKSKPLKGALVGGGVGLATGVVLGAIMGAGSPPDYGVRFGAKVVGTIGLAAGVGVGLILGTISKGEIWQEVSLDKLRVSVLPDSRDQGRMGVALRFERTF